MTTNSIVIVANLRLIKVAGTRTTLVAKERTGGCEETEKYCFGGSE